MKVLSILTVLFGALMSNCATFEGSHKYQANTILEGLKSPWAVVRAPDDRLYILEKAGKIIIVSAGKRVGEVFGIPNDLISYGQGGLMDLAFHPKFDTNQLVYLTYTTRVNAKPSNGVNTRVSRFELKNNRLTKEKILVQGGYGTDGAHFGSRLAFGKDGMLYAAFGERHNKHLAQDLKYLNGKIIRIKDDGSIPADNPYVDQAGARKEIYTLGHRNPQGLDIHPVTGAPVVSEHGPSGYDAELPGYGRVGRADEVNWLRPGGNYGWPTIFGDPAILPWTEEMQSFVSKKGIAMPVREFTKPDGIAPGGATFYTGNAFPKWKNDFFVAALRGYIVRLKISNAGKLVEEERIIPRGFSRVRDVEVGADGSIYAVTNRSLVQIKPTLQ